MDALDLAKLNSIEIGATNNSIDETATQLIQAINENMVRVKQEPDQRDWKAQLIDALHQLTFEFLVEHLQVEKGGIHYNGTTRKVTITEEFSPYTTRVREAALSKE